MVGGPQTRADCSARESPVQRTDLLLRSDAARGSGCNYVQLRWAVLAQFDAGGSIVNFGDARLGAAISTSRPLDLKDLDPCARQFHIGL